MYAHLIAALIAHRTGHPVTLPHCQPRAAHCTSHVRWYRPVPHRLPITWPTQPRPHDIVLPSGAVVIG